MVQNDAIVIDDLEGVPKCLLRSFFLLASISFGVSLHIQRVFVESVKLGDPEAMMLITSSYLTTKPNNEQESRMMGITMNGIFMFYW